MDYLRITNAGEIYQLPESVADLKDLLKEATYYEIDSMIEAINYEIKRKNDSLLTLNKLIITAIWIFMIFIVGYFSKPKITQFDLNNNNSLTNTNFSFSSKITSL